MSGNVLAAPVVTSYTTGTGADLVSPSVVGTNPAANVTVVVQFSEPLNPLTVDATTATLDDGIRPVAMALSLTGNPLGVFTSGFETSASATPDTTRPSVGSIDPPGGVTNVPLTQVITVTFSEPVSPVSVTTDTVRLTISGLGGLIPATVVLDASGTVAILTPTAALLADTTYRVSISSIQDYAGNVISSSSSTFTTIP